MKILIGLLLLASCSKEIELRTISAAQGYCAGRGGVDYIRKDEYADFTMKLECKDGRELRFSKGDVLFSSEVVEEHTHEE
jgi:hypothetical protein